jgi:EmrB/QacA subfamily drug resistance transporter
LTWVLNGYLISYGSFLLLFGRLGDLIGRRRVFLAGVALFTVASAACGLATTQAMLIAARFIQGLGGAAATSAIVAIIATEFPEPRGRAAAMSIYTFVISGGGSLGLIAGGVITQTIDWHWIFFVNVPIGIATVVVGRSHIFENRGLGIGRDVDALGSILVTAAMMLLAYAIVTSSSHGLGSAHTIGLGAVSLLLLGAFVGLESRLPNPIMPLRIFAARGLAASSLVRGLLVTGMFATFFLGVLYLERVRGYGVLQTGLAFLPQTLVIALLSVGPTAWLGTRLGPRVPLLLGLLAAGAGLLLLHGAGAHAHYFPRVLGAFVLVGAGAGLAFMPLLTLAMANVPAADAGLGSGIVNASLQMSAALGVAVLGTVAATHTKSLASQGAGATASLVGGYHLAFLVGAICVGVALLAALLLLRQPQPPATVAERQLEAEVVLEQV